MPHADSLSPTEKVEDKRPAEKEFRPDIEGLRGFTLLAILGFHAAVPGVGGGFVGPDVFFIISGFVITGQLWRELSGTGTIGMRKFFGARARRLLPVSVTVGIFIMIGAAILLPPLQARTAETDGIASSLYVGNYWFILRGVDYFATHVPPSPFEHYWTLGVEEQFYLLWPPVIIGLAWLIRRTRRRSKSDTAVKSDTASSKRPYIVVFSLITVVSFALSFVASYVAPAAAYFSLPTRAWDLSVGGILALTATQWRRLPPLAAAIIGWSGLGILLLACSLFNPNMPYPGTAALVPLVGTVLIIGAGCAIPSLGCGRILGWAPMRALGRLSYSWYLWHWPVLVFAPLVVGHHLGLAGRLIAVAISGVLGWLTLRYIETPLRYAKSLKKSPGLSLALGGAFTAIGAAAGLVLLSVIPTPVGRGTPAAPLTVTATSAAAGANMAAYDTAVRQTLAQVQAAVAASADLRAVPSNLQPPLAAAAAEKQTEFMFNGCLRSPFEAGQPECAMGDTGSATEVALIGDSHAAMWTPAFQKVASERHWRLELLAKGACPMLDLPITNPLNRLVELLAHCEEWRAQMISRLEAEHPRLIVLSLWRGYGSAEELTGYQSYDSVWIDRMTRLVARLRATGANVLVLGPIPAPGFVVPICLSGYLDDVPACTPQRSVAVNESGIAAEAAATQAGGGQYADLTDMFCTAERCPSIVGDTLVYLDDNHMTLEYSRALAPAIGALADRALAHS
ncbi:acyltransferase family protein [Mycolicibacterium sp. Dal123E01]|uniref:acyltransferase family protein n=1 Tax=Mycolicibacterium sp. Dal123E01 TaxID=3457578 RepID=UPI00403ED279